MPQMNLDQLRQEMPRIFAPWILELGLQPSAQSDGELQLQLPISARLVHVGGVLCGQASMAAADTAMVLLMMQELGEFRPMTTVQLQTSFVRPLSGAQALVRARLLRRGRQLAFGQIDLLDEQQRLAAQASTTYALL